MNLYTAAQVSEMDRQAIETHGIAGATLMARAGQAAFDALRRKWPGAESILVLAGVGNNAGDGFVIARLAHMSGLCVRVMVLIDPQRLKGDALAAAQAMKAVGIQVEWYASDCLQWADVIVDAMLGTGLTGQVREPFAECITELNNSGRPVLAVDLPSGLSADTGQPLGVAVDADLTVTFIAMKSGLWLSRGPEFSGELLLYDLDIPTEIRAQTEPSAQLLDLAAALSWLPLRRRNAHKGDFGHLLVIGGAAGFGGAARMAGEAALRCGSGLVSIATHRYHAAVLTAQRPELMCHPVDTRSDLDTLLQRATVVVLGPGLSQNTWAEALWDSVVREQQYSELPLLLDADALNLLAARPCKRDNWVLTPHPGEAARLLGESIDWVEQNRPRAIAALIERYGGSVVLKGAGSLVQRDGQAPTLCAAGNPGMASGGMGDVLSGVIGALMAQGLPGVQAATLGVGLHAAAGDSAVDQSGQRGLIATDLLPHLRHLINGV